MFHELCNLGNKLVGLHLMEKFGNQVPTYPIDGNHLVEKVEYVASSKQQEQGRVYLNKLQYFDGLPPGVLEFHVGDYQIFQKWLKDRKGRNLTYEDIQHYQRVVAALAETNTLTEIIDAVIDEHGGWPIV